MNRPVLTLQNVRLGTIALALSLVAMAPSAHAGILTPGSILNFSGVQIPGATTSTFQCNQPGDTQCATAPAGSGDFAVVSSPGSFAQYTGTFGLIKSVNDAVQPLNAIFSLPNWITFDLNNQITLELTFLHLGNDPLSTNCAGLTHCTPTNPGLITPTDPSGLSDFNLDQIPSGTTASFLVEGIAHANDGSTDPYSGSFTTTFTGETPQQAFANVLAGTAETYSGSITLAGTTVVGVPEPASLAVFVIALGALGFTRRRKRS